MKVHIVNIIGLFTLVIECTDIVNGAQHKCNGYTTLEEFENRCQGKGDKKIAYRTCDSVRVLYTDEEADLFCCHWRQCCSTCVRMIAEMRKIQSEKKHAMEKSDHVQVKLGSSNMKDVLLGRSLSIMVV